MAIAGDLPEGWEDTIPSFTEEDGPLATRAASGAVLNAVASTIDNLVGGSADLAPSNKTIQTEKSIFGPENGSGHNIHFGVREHAMAGIANGMALHGGVIPYVATFLIFSDYMRPSIRLSALMQTKVIYIFTHDSVGVGEDGPTHQPVEQTMSLRLIPGLTVLRPADANETAEAWCTALLSKGPVVLVLTRQKLPILDKNYFPINDGFSRGGYILSESNDGATDIILIATGSEVSLALQVQQSLSEDGKNARVISMPSWELFEQQPEEYRHSILPRSIPKVALEAGITMGWHSYIGDEGLVIGIDRFGASAPGPTVMDKLGMNKENVLNAVKNFLANQRI
jgi:transketolase